MEDNTSVETNFSATINAPIEKIDIPAWCFTLPEAEYQSGSPAQSGLRIRRFCQRKSAVADSAAEDRSGRPTQDRS